MRKFVISGTEIIEVEVEIIFDLWLPAGEFRAKIVQPELFHRKVVKSGEKKTVLEPSVYHSHAIYDSIEQAKERIAKSIRFGFDNRQLKYDSNYTEEEVLQAIDETMKTVKVVML